VSRRSYSFAVGIIQDLDYVVPQPNTAQRWMWKVSSSRPGAWFFSRTMHHIDKALLKLTKGRTTLPRVAAGIPVMTLTTTGAKTGLPRTMPLLGVPVGDDLAVIGTRFGQKQTPAWYYNLRANPDAEVACNGRHADVRAREVVGDEASSIWSDACQIYAGYEAYARRISGRTVHIMMLEPRPS
jgi:deazaflavin-dependent oxidoreductase (nitroreductase family)